jgi:nucleotide-binding universal stress UspA family protein
VGKIVIGFIDTPEGHAAVDTAIAEARLRGSELVVLHSMVGGTHETGDEYVSSAEAIEAVKARLADEGVEHCTHEYVRGNTPAQDIMQAVEDHDADLIVIGIRKRSTTGKILLGSNALDILHDTKVPVLCVKSAGRN